MSKKNTVGDYCGRQYDTQFQVIEINYSTLLVPNQLHRPMWKIEDPDIHSQNSSYLLFDRQDKIKHIQQILKKKMNFNMGKYEIRSLSLHLQIYNFKWFKVLNIDLVVWNC